MAPSRLPERGRGGRYQFVKAAGAEGSFCPACSSPHLCSKCSDVESRFGPVKSRGATALMELPNSEAPYVVISNFGEPFASLFDLDVPPARLVHDISCCSELLEKLALFGEGLVFELVLQRDIANQLIPDHSNLVRRNGWCAGGRVLWRDMFDCHLLVIRGDSVPSEVLIDAREDVFHELSLLRVLVRVSEIFKSCREVGLRRDTIPEALLHIR